jgi:hypothetical protein
LARLPKVSAGVRKRAAQIKVLLMDVDGTMTDGGVTLLSQADGSALEIKTFDAHDGQGLTLAHTAGIRTGCITGRESPALLRRANEMKMEFIYMKQPMKIPAYEEIVRKAGRGRICWRRFAGPAGDATRRVGDCGGECSARSKAGSALRDQGLCWAWGHT